MTFSIKRKLGGIFNTRNKPNIAVLREKVERSRRLSTLIQHINAPELEAIFRHFEEEAKSMLRIREASEADLRRANHRMELIANIRGEIERRIKDGREAEEKLNRLLLEERSNG